MTKTRIKKNKKIHNFRFINAVLSNKLNVNVKKNKNPQIKIIQNHDKLKLSKENK